jgi:hypothetical protein
VKEIVEGVIWSKKYSRRGLFAGMIFKAGYRI